MTAIDSLDARLEEDNARHVDEKVEFDLRASLRISLLERRLLDAEKRIAEIGALADRVAQWQQVRELSSESMESAADARGYHEASLDRQIL